MRLKCPLCGDRDRREFYYYGAEDYLNRPAAEASLADWDTYLHLRDNPAGETRDLWYHEAGCAQWLLVTRNTVTHAISAVDLVAGRKPAPAPARGAEHKPAVRAEAKPAPRAAAKRAPKAAAKAEPKAEPVTESKTGRKK